MIMVLIAIGLPSNLFILIFPVDFMLDRIRTTVNVYGDSIGAAIVGRLCADHLRESPHCDGARRSPTPPVNGGYHVLLQTASPDPSVRRIVNHYENHQL
jgi:hypothetical protein